MILERYINLIAGRQNDDMRVQYAQQLYDMLEIAYSKVGGLKGSGFASPEDMVKNIKFWKLVKKGGRIVAAAFYKDKGGRKRVAVCTDGSTVGKDSIAKIMIEDLSRSYFEISGPSLKFLCSRVGEKEVAKYAIPVDRVKVIAGEEIFEPVDYDEKEMSLYDELRPFFYRRIIGDKASLKIMLGRPGQVVEMASTLDEYMDFCL